VRLVGEHLKKYKVRTRNGYRPQPARFSHENRTAVSSAVPSTDDKPGLKATEGKE
jgi:hypothetical protein